MEYREKEDSLCEGDGTEMVTGRGLREMKR